VVAAARFIKSSSSYAICLTIRLGCIRTFVEPRGRIESNTGSEGVEDIEFREGRLLLESAINFDFHTDLGTFWRIEKGCEYLGGPSIYDVS